MARKLVLGAAAVVVVVGGAALVAPYFIGQTVESRFRAQVAAISQRTDIPIRVTAYRRHWFSADATTTARLGTRRVTLHYAIHHGPLPGFNLATIKTHWSAANLALTKGRDKPVVSAHTTVDFDGDSTTTIHAGQLEGDVTDHDGRQVHVVWQGLDGQLRVDDKQHLTLKSPGLRLQRDGVTSGYKNLTLTAQGARLRSGGLDELQPRDLVGRSDVEFGQVFFRGPGNRHNMTFSGSLESRSSVPKANRWNFHTALKLRDLALPPRDASTAALKIHAATLEAGFKDLNAHRFLALLDAIQPYQRQLVGADADEVKRINARIDALMLKRLPGLLTDDSVLQIGLPTLDTGRGAAGMQVTASLQPATVLSNPDRADRLSGLLQRAAVKASAHVDKPLMQWLLAQSEDPAKGRKALANLAQERLIGMQKGAIESSLYLDHKTMRVNGHALPDRMRRALLMGLFASGAH